MSVRDITTLVATHSFAEDTDEHVERVDWLAIGLLPYIRAQLSDRGIEIPRKHDGAVEVFAEIAIELMIIQHKHSAGVPDKVTKPAELQAVA